VDSAFLIFAVMSNPVYGTNSGMPIRTFDSRLEGLRKMKPTPLNYVTGFSIMPRRWKSKRGLKMNRDRVASSNIRSIGYETKSETLEVEFTSGSIYQYFDVPENEYERLMNAASKGRYFNQNIKDCYRYKQVR